jgi:hypothetical protein
VEHGEEVLGEFVIARGKASERLDAIEEALDEVAVFVQMAIVVTLLRSVLSRGNDRLSALSFEGAPGSVLKVEITD